MNYSIGVFSDERIELQTMIHYFVSGHSLI